MQHIFFGQTFAHQKLNLSFRLNHMQFANEGQTNEKKNEPAEAKRAKLKCDEQSFCNFNRLILFDSNLSGNSLSADGYTNSFEIDHLKIVP